MGGHAKEMNEDDGLGFNFWPAFADMMLSLVLILVLVMFLVYRVISANTVNLKRVEQNQMSMVQMIASRYGSRFTETGVGFFSVPVDSIGQENIVIRNEPTLQRFSFSDQILFPKDEARLSQAGEGVLRTVGSAIRTKLGDIHEIQIQGHADPDRSRNYRSNLHLAGERAIEVFKFLQDSVGVDPNRYQMSATTFGEFKPVQRADDDSTYNLDRLAHDNATEEMKGRNRRIELLLFYRIVAP